MWEKHSWLGKTLLRLTICIIKTGLWWSGKKQVNYSINLSALVPKIFVVDT